MSSPLKAKQVAILQPSYVPWLGHFDQIFQSDVFVLYDDVQFDKHGWRNRNRIKNLKGEPQWLTVPVRHTGMGKPLIKDVQIPTDLDWAAKHEGTIRQFYAKAPYFKTYFPEISEILKKPHTSLLELNLTFLKWFCAHFEIKTPIVRSSELNIEGGQTERLVKICQHFQAEKYLSGPSAKDYLDVSQFEKAQIQVLWHDYPHPSYPQVNGEFVSHLSALDSLLNVGSECRNFFVKK